MQGNALIAFSAINSSVGSFLFPVNAVTAPLYPVIYPTITIRITFFDPFLTVLIYIFALLKVFLADVLVLLCQY